MKPSLPPSLIRNKNKQWNFPTTFCPFSSLFWLNIYDPNLHDRYAYTGGSWRKCLLAQVKLTMRADDGLIHWSLIKGESRDKALCLHSLLVTVSAVEATIVNHRLLSSSFFFRFFPKAKIYSKS